MFQVADPVKAITAIDSPTKATTEGAQIIMRQVIGSHTLRHLLLHRKQLDAKLKLELEKRAKTWGVRIKSMEVKEVKLPRDVKKTIARGKREANLIEGNGHGTSDSEALNAQLSQILNIPES